jgi:DNA-binding transcriptional MerR regulator
MNRLVACEPPRVSDKSPDAFRTISEVAEDLDVPQHVLRFWETRFPQIKPLKRGGGRRYYRPDDIDLLKGIRHLLYGEGYTIKGVQRILKEDGVRFVQGVGRGERAVQAPAPAESARENPGEIDEDDGDEACSLAEGRPRPRASRPRPDAAIAVRPTLAGAMPGAAARADFDRLREALDELLECARLLAALKGEAPLAGEEPA